VVAYDDPSLHNNTYILYNEPNQSDDIYRQKAGIVKIVKHKED